MLNKIFATDYAGPARYPCPSLYFVFYNFCRVHKTLGATRAIAAGLVETVKNMTDVVCLIDARAAETPMVRGPYKKKVD